MSGTRRMENLPLTLRGITVLAPASEKAPSIPWRERDGYLQRCIRICSYRKKKTEQFTLISDELLLGNSDKYSFLSLSDVNNRNQCLALVSCSSFPTPTSLQYSSKSKSIFSYSFFSSSVRGATSSHIPGIKILPFLSTREPVCEGKKKLLKLSSPQ